MKIVATGILNSGEPRGPRNISMYPTLTHLGNGKILATYTVGSKKDSDDNTIEIRRSSDDGNTWSRPIAPFSTIVGGRRGSISVAYVTKLAGNHLMAAATWVDRQVRPGKPLFNSETEGILPLEILLSDSFDEGHTWTPWRVLAIPPELGPPALTNGLLRLSDGKLVLSMEMGKDYDDRSKWYQKVMYCCSEDQGKTWSAPWVSCQDPTGKIFNWDQRAGVAPDNRIVTFTWTYDHDASRYLNIHRRTSKDAGKTWTDPEDLGITDQPSNPAILPDGRVVLAWVDRFQSRSIKARLSKGVDAQFLPESEVVLYQLADQNSSSNYKNTGELLSDLHLWSFGLPYTEVLPNGDVIVAFYARDNDSLSARWTRLSL
jgi:hypothetical protein